MHISYRSSWRVGVTSPPTTLIPYHRTSDGELAGYLRQHAGGPVEPISLLGHTLAAPIPRDQAEALLERDGLAAVAAPWWVLAPTSLAEPGIDLRQPGPDWRWQRLVVVEANPSTVRLRPQYPPPGEANASVTVTLPADDILHASIPDEWA